MDMTSQRELSQLLAALRREGRQQSGLDPRLVPPDKETAYRVAEMVAEDLGWPVAGWKIAAMKEEMQKALRTDQPIYGRVFAPMVKTSPLSVVHAKLCSPIPEVEYQVRLGATCRRAPSPHGGGGADAVRAHRASNSPSAMVDSGDAAAFPPLPAILADGAGASTIVHGPPIEDWKSREIASQETVLLCNGKPRRKGTAAAALDQSINGAGHCPCCRLRTVRSVPGLHLRLARHDATRCTEGWLQTSKP